MKHAFRTAVAGVLLTTVCGMGFSAVEWDHDGILLPDCEFAPADTCDCAPRAIVNIRWNAAGDPETLFKGAVVTRERLRERMMVFAERWRDEEGWSVTKVLIRADRSVPWSAVRRVLDVCEEPDVRIHRLEFATFKPRKQR